ncbi:hypothetical protein SGUI_2005 [Serinicoccus hydrothermalis]|uniref:Uncharacterized protein n=1 Tax=Serinicoccus hydrothermalis TaxID=1758689 RepID=A0A1B1NDD5_9MICO|nr:hypothetical protein [Serinicoccus hydrothermalis]ANS79401.1 hypothetical protein SGUI_2005 [Serinicoccus hydrothermalis]
MADGLDPGEREQLTYALDSRLGPHLEAATAAVREAERALTDAQERRAAAEQAVAQAAYTSDPLPFMRQGVEEEVDGLARKTTEKKLRTSYRFLVDRAVDLAAAEVQRYGDDRVADRREREEGVEACREAERRATRDLGAAQQMLERVRLADQAARRGLDVLVARLSDPPQGG